MYAGHCQSDRNQGRCLPQQKSTCPSARLTCGTGCDSATEAGKTDCSLAVLVPLPLLSSDLCQIGQWSAVKLLCHARNVHWRVSSFWNCFKNFLQQWHNSSDVAMVWNHLIIIFIQSKRWSCFCSSAWWFPCTGSACWDSHLQLPWLEAVPFSKGFWNNWPRVAKHCAFLQSLK